MIQLEQAEGEFVLPQPIPRKLLLVTAGSGITPGDRHAAQPVLPPRPATPTSCCVHVNADRAGRDLPRRAAGARRGRPAPAGRAVRRQPRHARRRPSRRARPRPRRAARATPAGRPACSTRSRSTTPSAGSRCTTERFRPTVVEAGEGGTRHLRRRHASVEADGATPILDAAEGAGVLMPSGCRMGICMGCVLPMKEGAVRDLRNGALTVAVPGETGPAASRSRPASTPPPAPATIDH